MFKAVQAVDTDNGTGACVRELISSVASVLDLLGTLSSDQSARDKLLLERIRVMDEEISGLREQISSLSSQLSAVDGSSQSKKKKKNTKKGKEQSAESSTGSLPSNAPANEADGSCKIRKDLVSTQMSIAGAGFCSTNVEAESPVESSGTALECCTGSNQTDMHEAYNTTTGQTAGSLQNTTECTVLSSPSATCRPRGGQSGLPPITDDVPWQTLTRSKPRAYSKRALYIGNLHDETTCDGIALYVHERAKAAGVDVAVEGCSLIDAPAGSAFRGAHLLISAKHVGMLLKRRFWPKPVYARPWVFRDTSQPTNGASLSDEERSERVLSGSLSTSQSSPSTDTGRSQGAADTRDSRGAADADDSHDAVRLQNRFEPALSMDDEGDTSGSGEESTDSPERPVEDATSVIDNASHQDKMSTPDVQDPSTQKACTGTMRPVSVMLTRSSSTKISKYNDQQHQQNSTSCNGTECMRAGI